MIDLDRAFREAQQIPVTDLWPGIVTRSPSQPPPAPPNRRFAAIVVAALIAVIGVGLAVRAFTYAVNEPANPSPTHNPSATRTSTAKPQSLPLGVSIVGLDGAIQQLVGLPARASDLAVAPDGSQMAYVDEGEIATVAIDGSRRRTLTDRTVVSHAAVPSWSPDGQQIAFFAGASDDELYVMDADGGKLTRIATMASWASRGPSWSPDGTQLVYMTGKQDQLAVVDTRSGRTTLLPLAGLDPAWGPDGRIAYIVWHANGTSSLVMSEPDGSHREVLSIRNAMRGGSEGALSWSPDGLSIAFVTYCEQDSPGLAILDVTTGRVRELVQPCGSFRASGNYLNSAAHLGTPTWVPSGRAVVVGIW